MHIFGKGLVDKARQILASKYFFYAILMIAALQGLWYAVSFQPAMYDEPTHFGYVRMYTQHVSPFITHQDPSFDSLGETTRNPSYLFYYLMSWPLRLVELFTQQVPVQLLALRSICIVIFIAALIYYRKTFLELGASKSLANVVLAFFVITPGVAILPGVLSYDNPVIFFTALLFYLAVRSIKDSSVNLKRLGLIIGVVFAGTLMKYTLMVVAIPIIIFLAVDLYKKHGASLWPKVKKSYTIMSQASKVLTISLLLISSLLFVERIGYNVIKYHDTAATCLDVLSRDRCLKNDVTKRNIINVEKKSAGFNPIDIYNYTLSLWLPTIIRHHASPVRALPVMHILYLTFGLLGSLFSLLYLRDLIKNRALMMLVISTVFYVLVVLLENYSSYKNQGIPVAMNGRYIFPVLPVLMFVFGLSVIKFFGERYKIAAVLSVAMLIILMSQGGGLITYLLDYYEPIYWQNDHVLDFNREVKQSLSPLVKGG
jgi:hypothetical protein